jgi:hypothetical protein
MSSDSVVRHLDPRLKDALDEDAQQRLRVLAEEVVAEPARIRVHHPAAARTVGRGVLEPSDPAGLHGPTVDDAVRAVLVTALGSALRQDADALLGEVSDLYRYGDADEKRAVVRALHLLDIGDAGLPLVADALRTNDIRLVAAALGPYGGEHLPDDAWRQGVLKCLFVEVPLTAVSRLDERCDAELAGMVAAYAHERVAAGRAVPADVWLVLRRHPEALDQTPVRRELESPYPDRRAAARAFFDDGRATAATDQATPGTKEA